MPVSKLFFLELGLCHSGHSMNPLFSSVHVMSFSDKAPVIYNVYTMTGPNFLLVSSD